MLRFWPALCALLFLLAPSAAEARKVALIIGNGDYANTSRLVNPANDIRIIAASARSAGFDDVTIASDLAVNDFQKAMRDFRAKADGAEVAMVYYAGHGIEAQGKNWLIPTDAQLKSDLDLPYEAINLDRLMESVSGAQIRMVILDSCRNNPFGRSWRSGTRAVVNGLAGVEADDVLVIFAAAPGQTAADGTTGNSPFATSLAKRLPQPDVPVQLLGGLIRDDVLAATGGSQRPFVSASITGTPVYLVPRASGASGERRGLEELLWKGAMAENNVEAFKAYLAEFPSGKYAGQANDNINRLLKTPDAIAAPVTMVAMKQPTATARPATRKFTLTNIRVECIKLTGRLGLGLPDQLFLRFNTGQRFPEGKGDIYSIKKGESWVVDQIFEFDQPVSFQLREFDDIGGSDNIGTIDIGETAGTFTKTLDGDASDYRVTYTLVVS
ncbi:MAG: caspase family protein [Sphingopyxis sp.]|uniref:caspase family protein n=1 Tax=Sphingopyxis sp. TaxID=1908224 RepID=UPI001A5AF9F5|nr:caspase family protein [Sphingopyxis sp.]MBL9068170.1 caspase family protein [Sphingopyxis sp.]